MNVRIFGYRGTRVMSKVLPQQFSSDSVMQLDQPYIFAQMIVVGSDAISSTPDSSPDVTLLRIEIPDGETVRYEINPPGRDMAAGEHSPSLSGKDQFLFSPGWSISFIDAAGLP